MKTNNRHVFPKNHPVARTARALVAALACAAIGNAAAADWEVSTPQEITNALTKLSKNDTILVKPGTYDFTGIEMGETTWTYPKTGGTTYTIKNHLACSKVFSLIGDTEGHWDDEVIFKGNVRCLDATANVTIRNITFDGFNGAEYSCSGTENRGGALRLGSSDSYIVSNCVFRNCNAYIGGAVNGGVLTDCILTNNSAKARGGATCGSCMRDCRVLKNKVTGGNSGAFYGHRGLYNTLFEGNSCTQSGGAGEHQNNTYLITLASHSFTAFPNRMQV